MSDPATYARSGLIGRITFQDGKANVMSVTTLQALHAPMGAFLLLASDHRVAADGAYRIGMNEVAIGLTVLGFAVELARQRLSPAYFSRAVVTGEMFGPAEAALAGFVDRVVPAAELERAADDEAETLSRLDLAAHHATKMRARASSSPRCDR